MSQGKYRIGIPRGAEVRKEAEFIAIRVEMRVSLVLEAIL
jgi:hypothetical protein